MKLLTKTALTLTLSLFFLTGNLLAQENVVIASAKPATSLSENKSDAASEKTAKEAAEISDKKTGESASETYPEAISDNSFLIEEAYNQEPGVMQTISTCSWFRRPQSDVACTVTQEFPVTNQKHQLSYTAPYSFLDSNRTSGLGDVTLNYRYQLTGERDWAVVAPRISLVLPTGSTRRGLGEGSTGLQFNLPVSKRLNKDFVAHFNAGLTYLPKVKGEDFAGNKIKRSLTSYNVGGSLIWLAHKRANLVMEYLENFSGEINGFGKVERFNEHILNPGVRFAVDFGPLQIVPGVSIPTSIIGNETRTGVFFYLSFEHPFKKLPR